MRSISRNNIKKKTNLDKNTTSVSWQHLHALLVSLFRAFIRKSIFGNVFAAISGAQWAGWGPSTSKEDSLGSSLLICASIHLALEL